MLASIIYSAFAFLAIAQALPSDDTVAPNCGQYTAACCNGDTYLEGTVVTAVWSHTNRKKMYLSTDIVQCVRYSVANPSCSDSTKIYCCQEFSVRRPFSVSCSSLVVADRSKLQATQCVLAASPE